MADQRLALYSVPTLQPPVHTWLAHTIGHRAEQQRMQAEPPASRSSPAPMEEVIQSWMLPVRIVLSKTCHGALLTLVLGLLLLWSAQPTLAQGDGFDACLGETRSLLLSGPVPYTLVQVNGRQGFFLLDFGSDSSAISPTTFLGGAAPIPLPGSTDRFASLEFFSPWREIRLAVQNHGSIRAAVPQAGLLGTDLLVRHVFTLDPERGLLHRAPRESFCSDALLRRVGFVPVSSRGYYSADRSTLRCPAAPDPRACPNIPTVPIRIGTVTAVAQLDTGYDDSHTPRSLTINTALLRRLQATGLRLQRDPGADLQLSTCAGVAEPVSAYQLPPGTTMDLLADDGRPAQVATVSTLFVKGSPPLVRRCGGIGTWTAPAAQLGASQITSQGAAIFDPFSSRIWLRPARPTGAVAGAADRQLP